MRIVLDTNVIVSRFLSPAGTPAKVLDLWKKKGYFDVVVSEEILQEYARALTYSHIQARHQIPSREIETYIHTFSDIAILVVPTERITIVKDDPDDNTFIACALAGNAEYIISGDRDLLRVRAYNGVRILTPAAFLTLIEHEQKAV